MTRRLIAFAALVSVTACGVAIVRFVFVRDSAGRVSSLNRLIYGSVMSWARIP